MSKTASSNAVGVDAFYREIFPGDTIQDLDGIRWTVEKDGVCKSLATGSIRKLSAIKEPAVVGAVAPPFAEGPDGKVGPAKAPEAPAETPAGHKLGSKPGVKRGPYHPRSAAVKDKLAAARNKSGYSDLSNMVRGLLISSAEARVILEEAGIEVSVTERGKTRIRIEDRPRAMEILRAASPTSKSPAKVKPIAEAPAISDEDKALLKELAHVPNPSPADLFPPPLSPEVEEAIKRGKLPVEIRHKDPALTKAPDSVFPGSYDDLLPGFTPETCTVRDAGEKMLADELRRRGFTVTATKTMTIEL